MSTPDPFAKYELPGGTSQPPGLPPAAAITPRNVAQVNPLARYELAPPAEDPLAKYNLPQDIGPTDTGILTQLRSAGVWFLKGATDPIAAPLENVGSALTLLNEDDFRAWAGQSREERRKGSIAKGLDYLSNIVSTSAGGGPTGVHIRLFADMFSKDGATGEQIAGVFNRIDRLALENQLPGFWSQDLPHAVGTTGAIGLIALSVGVASRGKIPPWAVAGWVGSQLGADEALDDAVEHGATAEQAAIAAGVGAALGTTEALPIIMVLNRVDTATGGAISRPLNRVFRQKLVGSVLVAATKGALEEGIQEAFQQVGNDVAAHYIYDPERGFTDRLANAAATGGGTGFILSGVATALGIPLQRRQRRIAVRKEVATITGQPVTPSQEEAISRNAPFTPLPARYFEIQQGIQATLTRMEVLMKMQEEGRTLTDEELKEQLGGPIGINFGTGHWTQGQFNEDLGDLDVNPEIETGLPLVPDETQRFDDAPMSVLEAIKLQPVVVSGFNYWNNRLKMDEELVAGARKAGTPLNEEVVASNKLRNEQMAKVETRLANDLKNLFAGLRGKYLDPDTKIIISSTAMDTNSSAFGGMYTTDEGRVVHIAVNTKSFIMEGFKPEAVLASAREVGLHEFGHVLVNQVLESMAVRVEATTLSGETVSNALLEPSLNPAYAAHLMRVQEAQRVSDESGVPAASQQDLLTYNGIMTQYKSWLENQLKNPFIEKFRSTSSPAMLQFWERQLGETNEGHLLPEQLSAFDSDPSYFYSFDEFMAENFARAGTQHAWVTDSAKGFFEEQQALLKELYRDAGGNVEVTPAELLQKGSPITSMEGAEQVLKDGERLFAMNAENEQLTEVTDIEALRANIPDQLFALPPIAESTVPTLSTMSGFTNWIKLMSNEGKMEALIKELAGRTMTRYDFMRNPEKAKEFGLDPNAFRDFEKNMDNYQRWYSTGLNILQLAKLNPHLEPLQRYIRLTETYNNKIGAFRWRGHNTMVDWKKVGRKQSTLVGELLYNETIAGKFISDEKLATAGLSEDGIKVFKQIKQDFTDVLARMEKVLMSEIRQNLFNNEIEMNAQMKAMKQEFEALRAKPFFPLIRFGRHTVRVTEIATGKLVEFSTFESRRERQKAMKGIRADYPGSTHTIGKGLLTDSQVAVQGMQGPLLRELRNKLEQQGNLTPEMQEALEGMLKDSLPIDSFRRHFARRRKVKGFSEDSMRSYATYMMQAATHLARIEMQSDLNTSINNIAQDSREMTKLGQDGTKRAQIGEMTREHFDFMMNPSNDWPMLRSAGFVWYLGYNLKSAFVNSTQMFLATHPYLATRFGDVAATKSLSKAVRDYTRYWKGGKNMTKEQLELMAKGKADGILDESLATELAIAKSSSGLDSSLPMKGFKRTMSKVAEYSAWPFHTVEKMNRALTALATHDLYLKQGYSQQQAMAMAFEAVRATQFEYARWARPKFMRGKVGSNVFLFKNYQQNMLFLALGNDPAAARVMYGMAVLAGAMGLPFAEDALDLFDVAATKLKRMFKWDNPKVQSRVFVREMLMEMEMNPDLIMHGLGESSMGLGYLGELTGYPIPDFNLQGSLSMGNVIPGTRALKRLQEGNPNQAFFDFLGELGGAEAGIMADVANALLVDNPDTWRRWETSLPSALRNLSKGVRYSQRGGEFTSRGQPIAEFDEHNAQDRMEVAGQMLGFTPTKVSKGWEAFVAEREVVTYYEAWGRAVRRNYNYSRLYEDAETIEDNLQAVRDYNKQVPFPEMGITGESLRSSLRTFIQQRAEAGQSIPSSRKTARLSREIRALYDQP